MHYKIVWILVYTGRGCWGDLGTRERDRERDREREIEREIERERERFIRIAKTMERYTRVSI
jgi:hypothetical protein